MRNLYLPTDGNKSDIIDWIKNNPSKSKDLDFTRIFNKEGLYRGTISVQMVGGTFERLFAREINLGCTFEFEQYQDTRIYSDYFCTYFEVDNNVYYMTR